MRKRILWKINQRRQINIRRDINLICIQINATKDHMICALSGYCIISIQLTKFEKSKHIKCWRTCRSRRSFCLVCGYEISSTTVGNNFILSYKVEHPSSLWPSTFIPTRGKFSICVPGALYKNVHSSIACTSKKLKQPKHIHRRKHELWYSHTTAYHTVWENEWNISTCM